MNRADRKLIFFKCASAFAALSAPFTSSALYYNGQINQLDQPSVQASGLVIANTTNVDLTFILRPADGEWATYRLSPGQLQNYICDQCSTDSFEFVIASVNGEMRYDLPSGKRYILAFNEQKKLWDLFEK